MRHLDFFKVVDAHRIGVALLREEDLHEVPDDRKLHRFLPPFEIEHGKLAVRGILGLPAGNKECVENALRHLGKGKVFECAAGVSARIAILEPAGHHFGKPRAGDNAQLANP